MSNALTVCEARRTASYLTAERACSCEAGKGKAGTCSTYWLKTVTAVAHSCHPFGEGNR